MTNKVYLNEIQERLKHSNIDFFEEELVLISNVFDQNKIDSKTCFNFFTLILETRNLLYKFNLHLIYEPFDKLKTNNLVWNSFKITDGFQTKLEVSYNSNYTLMRIEDNLSALFY